MIIIKITESIQEIEAIIKSNAITKDGEIVELHDKAIDNITKQVIKANAKKNMEQSEQNKRGIEIRKEITEFEQILREKLGQFYFNFYNNIPHSLEKQYVFRFIYLCCYLKHDDNRLQIQQNSNSYKLIKEGELMELLKLKKVECYKTKTALIENKLMYIDENKNIIINNNISFVGKVPKENYKYDYTRIFKESIKELYEKSNPREHKKLALFIELLPYIHFKYNIVCKNPSCALMEDIEPLTLKELSEAFNQYTNKNTTTLKKQLLNIFIGGKKATLLIEDYGKKFFVINPLIYYKGNRIEELNYLINLFKV